MVPSTLLLGAAGRIAIAGDTHVIEADANGTEFIRFAETNVRTTLAVSAAGDAFFSWAQLGNSDDSLPLLQKFNVAAGTVQRSWNLEPTRTAVLDPIEDVTWNGRLDYFLGSPDGRRILVSSDAIYLTGKYENEYHGGAIERPTTHPLFVARYDLSGKRKWFQELLLESDPYDGDSIELQGVALDPDGNLVLAEYLAGIVSVQKSFLHRLSGADGHLL